MDLQNKNDNLDEQQQAELVKYVSRLEKEKQLTKLISKRQKQLAKEEPKKKKYLLKLCLQRIKLMKALMMI